MAVRIADNVAVEDSGERLLLMVLAACGGRASADAAKPAASAATTKIRRTSRVLTCSNLSLLGGARMSRPTRIQFKSDERQRVTCIGMFGDPIG
jgi:hypothetical protein